jgi:hypothetical protein
MSLVWKRQGLSNEEFRRLWLGEHVRHALTIPGVLEYTIDFVTEGSNAGPAAIATLRFDDRAALERGFADPTLNEHLRRTREEFSERVEVVLVEEHHVLRRKSMDTR